MPPRTRERLVKRSDAFDRRGPVKHDEEHHLDETKKGDRERTHVRAARLVPYLAILAPFVVALLYVRLYGVDVFYADEWDLVPLLRESARGTLGVADLLAHHNGHVYLFPWSLMLLLGGLTGYDTVPLMYLVVACLLATSLAIFHAYARSVGRSPLACLFFLPVPLLLFSLRQHENLLWGNQITFAFAQTFSVIALYLLFATTEGRREELAFPASALCAAVASCSAAPGLLAWPAGLVLLMISPGGGKPPGRLYAGAWGLLGAAVWIFYLAGRGGSGAAATAFRARPPRGLGRVPDHPLRRLALLERRRGPCRWHAAGPPRRRGPGPGSRFREGGGERLLGLPGCVLPSVPRAHRGGPLGVR